MAKSGRRKTWRCNIALSFAARFRSFGFPSREIMTRILMLVVARITARSWHPSVTSILTLPSWTRHASTVSCLRMSRPRELSVQAVASLSRVFPPCCGNKDARDRGAGPGAKTVNFTYAPKFGSYRFDSAPHNRRHSFLQMHPAMHLGLSARCRRN